MTKSLYALVGMKHRGTEALVASLPQGEPLTLLRERNNRYDPFAIQVWARGQHVGYVKATQVRPLALAMDREAGSVLDYSQVNEVKSNSPRARLAIDGGKWPMIELEE